jgi:hypothetical protein
VDIATLLDNLNQSSLSKIGQGVLDYLINSPEMGNLYKPETEVSLEILDTMLRQMTTFSHDLSHDSGVRAQLAMLTIFGGAEALLTSLDELSDFSDTVTPEDSVEEIFRKEAQALIDFLGSLKSTVSA